MILTTSTNLCWERPDRSVMPLEKAIPLLAQAGFKILDMNFYDWALPGSPFLTSNWRSWIDSVKRTAEQNGVSFIQGHAYTFDYAALSEESSEYQSQQELVERSLDCLAILGTKVCVTHPSTRRTIHLVKDSKSLAFRYMKRLADYAEKYGMRIAVENMCDKFSPYQRKYFVSFEEISDFFDTVNDSRLGLCWDFEHGLLMRHQQEEILYELKKVLIATHVSDSLSNVDTDLMHVPPFFGRGNNWGSIMPVLHKIGYKGCFSFESHNFTNWLPDEVLVTGLELCHQIGQKLFCLADSSTLIVDDSNNGR